MFSRVLSECSKQLVDGIHCVIVTKVPADRDRADIASLYKGRNQEEPQTYSPVSLMSVVAKTCDKLLRVRWMKYLENKRLIDKQFAF